MKPNKLIIPFAIAGLALSGCGSDNSSSSATTASGETTADSATATSDSMADHSMADDSMADHSLPDDSMADDSMADDSMADSGESAAASGDLASCATGETLDDGVLTVATGEPAFPPYVIDDDPTNGEGLESAVAYAIADQLGFAADQVTWVRTTFDEAIQPGPKNFDFNVQQYSITPERSETISFSTPYYTSTQAILGLDGSAAAGKTTVADLSDVKFGVMAGTTSKDFVDSVIAPSTDTFVYDDNVAAKAGLESNQVDAIVVDLPTAFYMAAAEIEGSSVIAQFPVDASGDGETWGAVFEKDNPLVDCVDQALAALTASGELDTITTKWMSSEAAVPVLEVG